MNSYPHLANDTTRTTSAWLELETACDEAIQASTHVGACLDEGVDVAEFVPLLRRELELARALGRQLKDIRPVDLPSLPDGRNAARDRLASRLRKLLDLETRNQRLLSRRGVKINGLPGRPGARQFSSKSGTHESNSTSA